MVWCSRVDKVHGVVNNSKNDLEKGIDRGLQKYIECPRALELDGNWSSTCDGIWAGHEGLAAGDSDSCRGHC